MTDDARTRFLQKLEAAWHARALVKFTLSQPHGAERDLKNLYGRAVELREGRRLSLNWRYSTRDVTKNLPIEEALAFLGRTLGEEWKRAHLFTTTGDWQLRCEPNGSGTLKASRPAFAVVPAPEHDREKATPLTVAESGWLRSLGVTNAASEARPGMAPKLRQIQRFVELLGHLIGDSPLRNDARSDSDAPIRVIDMGAGKGYLTFAIAEFFRQRAIKAEVTGVEARADLVELTNRVAREHGFSELNFVPGRIGEFIPPHPPDVLIALHACDTATDDALAQGVHANAALIVAAPCCHKEVRSRMQAPPVLREILRHGILAERQAEILTDGLRALLLEMHGYRASVFEFISPEETSKNLMLAAVRRAQPVDAALLREQWRALMEFHGLGEQRLAVLLGEKIG
ncbi:MAG TPA: SAM-dependent methyltransferase [Chthoniobacter sp.]|jgi:SAM-dependent methyltransferase